MSLQGLFGCRNFMVSIETKWQAALCFAHGCFPNLGFHFYFTQSPNANSLSRLNPFKLTPSMWETTSTFAIDTLCNQCDYTWCLWVPLVPEPIGPIDQFSLNMFSMANALVPGLFNKKKPLCFILWL